MKNVRLKDQNLPGNSNKKKITPVVVGGVDSKRPSVGSRVKSALTDSDSQSVWEYILYDVAIPSLKTFITDAVSMGVNMFLWGDNSRPNSRGYQSRGHTSYNRMYGSGPSTIRGSASIQPQRQYERPRQRNMLDDLIFESRVDAETVLNSMHELLEAYNQVSVLDLYDLIGKTTDHAANNFGWVHLVGSNVVPARGGGFLLVLPDTEML